MTEGAALRSRVLSALVFVPVALALTLVGGWALELALLALVTAAAREMSVLLTRIGLLAPTGSWLLAPIVFLAALHLPAAAPLYLAGWIVWGGATLWLFFPWRPRAPRDGLVGAIGHAAGCLYVAVLPAFLFRLATVVSGDDASRGLLLALLVTWACDSGAYAAGFTFRGPRLWPAVSPGKTWAGAVGGLIASILVTLVLGPRWFPLLTPLEAALLGAAVGCLGPLGDLFESRLKRLAGVKDTGVFLPGHGGVLDRFDSLLYVAPVFGLLLDRLAR